MSKKYYVTAEGLEKLKAKNQMLWIQKMNTCKNIAEEIVLREIVYGDEI